MKLVSNELKKYPRSWSEALSRAKEKGCLTRLTEIRRPQNVLELEADLVTKDSMNSKIHIDIKRIDGSGRRFFYRQTSDINENIKDLFYRVDNLKKVKIICDLSPPPTLELFTVGWEYILKPWPI